MKKVLLVLFVLVVSASLSFAGTPMTSQGSKALSFVINGLGNFGVSDANLGSYNTPFGGSAIAGFGGKYYISNDMELRGVLGFSMSTTQHKDGTPQNADAGKTATTMFSVALALLWHMSAVGSVSPYWGVGAAFGWAKETNTPQPTGLETSSSGTVIGLAGILGAEWYAWDGISFNAEYQLGFSSNSQKSDQVVSGAVTSVDGTSYTNIGISSWAVGINVYLGQ